jgi:hypothetical protein
MVGKANNKSINESFHSKFLEHLHQLSVCYPALEILDEVQESNPMNICTRRLCDPAKMHNFESPEWALKQSNKKLSQIVFMDCSLFDSACLDGLIGPGGLLPINNLLAICTPSFSLMSRVGKKKT